MRCTAACVIACVSIASLLGGAPVLADSVFTIEDPPVDFEVIDADDGSGEYFFDGIGDFGPFYTFNDAALGSFGEARSMAEFDISPFVVPPGEVISVATFEVRLTSIGVWGLGIEGEIPEGLAVDGYVANGLDELSDFQAGDGNELDSVATPDPQQWDIVTFDVTSFVIDMVNAQEQYVGLTVRAETFGGLMMEEGAGYPKLTIETTAESEPCVGDLDGDGDTDQSDLGILLADWGCTSDCSGDLDDDDDTDQSDLGILLADWGCTP